MKIIIFQRGAREHYLIARALFERQLLVRLVVDWYPKKVRPMLGLAKRVGIKKASRALAKYCENIPDRYIVGLKAAGIVAKLRSTAHRKRGDNPFLAHLVGNRIAGKAFAHVRLPLHDIVIAYSYAAHEVLLAAKNQGKLAVLCQIDPGMAERKLVEKEREKWPEYFFSEPPVPEAYEDRLRKEWDVADVIIVNSKWSKDALVAEGVPTEKIEILPLAYDPVDTKPKKSRSPELPLRVLWLGSVIPRKGIQYLVEAARRLKDEPIEFVVAGPIRIPLSVVKNAPDNIKWVGVVSRSDIPALYCDSDVFVLPTISDGFAITQLEAMSYGIPVIATSNCGHVVNDGSTGFIIASHDEKALADAILKFERNRNLIESMRLECCSEIKNYSIPLYGDKLVTLLRKYNV